MKYSFTFASISAELALTIVTEGSDFLDSYEKAVHQLEKCNAIHCWLVNVACLNHPGQQRGF